MNNNQNNLLKTYSKKHILTGIVIAIIFSAVIGGYLIYNRGLKKQDNSKIKKPAAESKSTAGEILEPALTGQQIETIIGQSVNKDIRPLIEEGFVTGVATGSPRATSKTPASVDSSKTIGPAPSNLQEEIEKLKR